MSVFEADESEIVNSRFQIADFKTAKREASRVKVKIMKTTWIALLLGLNFLAWPGLAAEDLTPHLQHGLLEEEANQNLPAAIEAYQAVLDGFAAQRKVAATAVFRLGECYRKLGRTNDAVAQYESILNDFPDQATLRTLSEQNLLALGVSPQRSLERTAFPKAPSLRERNLILDEIKLAEQQLAEVKKRVEAGVLPPIAVFRYQRELTRSKRELAMVDEGPSSSAVRKLLQDEIRLQEEVVKEVQKRLANGKADLGEEIDQQRDLLSLKRELAALDEAPETAPTATAEPNEEEKEIQRIQGLIRNSPDLINARRAFPINVAGAESMGTPLHKAVANGQLVVAGFLLDHGANPNLPDSKERTPLHLAVLNGHKAMAELLLAHGAQVNATDNKGETPLHLAAKQNYRAVAEVLLEHGAKVDATDREGNTPLHEAATTGGSEMVRLLLDKGTSVNVANQDGYTPLHEAVANSRSAVAAFLVDHGANTNLRTGENQRRRLNFYPSSTPLMIAVYHGDAATAKVLLEHGSDANEVQPPAESLLNRAVRDRNLALAELLVKHGADVNAPLEDGKTPLFTAINNGRKDFAELLMTNGAKVNLTDKNGVTPLNYLSNSSDADNHLDIANLLIKAGADVNSQSKGQWTPLHSAVLKKQERLVELLLNQDADPNLANDAGWTPLHMAANQRLPSSIFELLLDHGANPNAVNRQGVSPLGMVQGVSPLGMVLPGNSSTFPIGGFRTPHLPRRGRIPSPGSVNASDEWSQKIAEILRRHGAVDDPVRDRFITLRRLGTPNAFFRLFERGTNDANHFTLLEALAKSFTGDAISFPDFSSIQIRRLTPGSGAKDQVISLDVRPLLESRDGSKDVRLEWGDIIEVPVAEHPLEEPWRGLSNDIADALKTCLERRITVRVKDSGRELVLSPSVEPFPFQVKPEGFGATAAGGVLFQDLDSQFRLSQVLKNQKLLLTSSDLAHVKVTRTDPGTGKSREFICDVAKVDPVDDLWLRNGDIVNVPEK
jgi:ankyrin repeat protein